MAYRFLLHVPATLANDANVAVATAGDAQVVVERKSHGLEFDNPFVDLTIAAHSLRVVRHLYDWAEEVGAIRPESRTSIGIVLHSGERIGLHESDPQRLVATIRRDQPWVERSLPKIGEHEQYVVSGMPENAPRGTATATVQTRGEIRNVDLVDAEGEITVHGVNWPIIDVADLAAPEQLYRDLFGLDLVERVRQGENETWERLGTDYDHDVAGRTNTEADIAFMRAGALHVAVRRVGRAARLQRAELTNQIGIEVDASLGARIKAQVLMRGYSLLGSAGEAFAFRDPYGVVWKVHPAS